MNTYARTYLPHVYAHMPFLSLSLSVQHKTVCKFLLQVRVMTPEEMHDRPQWHACFHHRSLTRLKRSYQAGVPIDFVYFDSITLLVQASLYGCDQVVEWCIDNGANLNHQSATGHSALTNAVSGHFEVCVFVFVCSVTRLLKLIGVPSVFNSVW
jgi:Ankyrin repeats (many copies)